MNKSKKRLFGLIVLTALSTVMLGGCMYPKENLAQNKASTREAVRNMQTVIEQYQQETGMLPIKNSTSETPKYEKYIVDLAKLQRMAYISELPGVSFEKGGSYYFLIQDEETKPTVKLMDLVTFQAAAEIQGWVDAYRRSNNELPVREEAYPGFSWIDYSKLGKKEPAIRSIYSGMTLSAMIDQEGRVFVDYGIDVMKAVERSSENKAKEGVDLRDLLVASSEFVPVKSTAYHWINGDPQAVAEAK
ncbi:hypothetical protein ACFOQM_20025 [Paenibacillus sp. GCM10012307]|uniref:Lipoprotein n=1 Tax=Paenibacillus roseus TaxID=2798579 RepID=A0A934JAZ8_9BACL|nr:hypothetical protein [Paenibacillus roseus]MBJ6363515.1 hypothetical protein [Paenibacillus roseus]